MQRSIRFWCMKNPSSMVEGRMEKIQMPRAFRGSLLTVTSQLLCIPNNVTNAF